MFGFTGVSQREEKSFGKRQISLFYFPHLLKHPNLKGLGITQTNCTISPSIKQWESKCHGNAVTASSGKHSIFPSSICGTVYFLSLACCRAVTPESLEEGTTEPNIFKNLQTFIFMTVNIINNIPEEMMFYLPIALVSRSACSVSTLYYEHYPKSAT